MRTASGSFWSLLLSCGLLAHANPVLAGGVVTQPTETSLKAAVAGGGTVTFACNGTITLSQTLSITQDTTLDAAGYQMTLSGGNAVRLFAVTNVTFQLNGLTLANGRFVGTNGNTSPGSGQLAAGGCLFNLNGTVNLTGCTLTNHSVQGGTAGTGGDGYYYGDGGDGVGGAIYSSGGHLNLTNCQVLNCTATGGEGGVYYDFGSGRNLGTSGMGRGGALCVVGASLNLKDVTLANNSAVGGVGQVNPNAGTAPAADACAGAIYATNSPVYAVTTVLTGNAAVGGSSSLSALPATGSGSGNGGALCLAGTTSGVFDRCVFSANSATAGNPGNAHATAGSGLGGAVFTQSQFQALNCTFQGNVATGTGFPSMYGARAGRGGALYSTLSAVLTGCTFSGNTARGGQGYVYMYPIPGGPGEGGAVWNSGTLAMTNSTLSGNRAVGGQYPSYVGSAEGDASGGAFYLNGGVVTLMHVTVATNYAGPDPGLSANGLAQGGAIMNNGSTVLVRGSVLAYSTRTFNNYSGTSVTCCSNVWGTLTDGGYNLSSDTTGGFSATGSQMNVDPMLAPLANYGGLTATCWLLPGSPARNQIPSGYPAVDQRGAARPQGPAADIGAVEADDSAASGFTLAASLSGGHLSLSTTGDSWRAYRLLSSTDLLTWTPVATNSPSASGMLQFTSSVASPRVFYRVVTP